MRGHIPKNFIQQLIDRTDIVPIIQSRVQLKKAGANFMGRCPFHEEKSPSFTVSPNKQFYHCFGCGVHGNVLTFLMEYDRLEFVAAVEYLAAQLGMDVPRENSAESTEVANYTQHYALLEEANQYYQQQLKASEHAITYLKKRGLDGKTAKQFQIGFAPDGWENISKYFSARDEASLAILKTEGLLIPGKNGLFDRFHDRIMFPIRDVRGRVIGFGGRTLSNDPAKYLNSPETPLFHKGEELYGLYEARLANRKLDTLLIVEGYLDVIALAQFGVTNAVATLGTATTAKQAQKLFRYAHELIFCFDGDNAGRQAAWKALVITLPLLHDGIQAKFLFLPESEDPDSFIRKQGADAFKRLLKTALSIDHFFFGELQKQVPLDSLDNKARFSKEALHFIEQIPTGIFKHLMLEKLSALLQIETSALTHITKPAAIPAKTKQPETDKTELTAPIRLILALLLQHTEIALNSPHIEKIELLCLSGSSTLKKLTAIARLENRLHVGQLLENLDDTEEKLSIAELAHWQHHIPHENIAEEFDQAILRALQLQKQRTLATLISKSKATALSDEEQALLQQLLREKIL